MSGSSAASFAAGVSAAIRKAVIRPLPSGTPITHQGVRVSRSYVPNAATVMVDIDLPRKAARMADQIDEALTAAGYTVTRNERDATILNVTREEA